MSEDKGSVHTSRLKASVTRTISVFSLSGVALLCLPFLIDGHRSTLIGVTLTGFVVLSVACWTGYRSLMRVVDKTAGAHQELEEKNQELVLLQGELMARTTEAVQKSEELERHQDELQQALDHVEIQRAMHDHAARRFESLFNGLPAACITFDAQGTVFEINTQASELFNVVAHCALLHPLGNVLRTSETTAPILQEILDKTVREGAKTELDWCFELSGETRIVSLAVFPLPDPSGSIVGGICSAIDVTDQRQAEQRVIKSEQRFRDIVEAAGEYIWETDAEWKFTYLTPQFKEVLGYEPEEMIGQTGRAFSAEEDMEKVRAAVMEMYKQRKAFNGVVHQAIHKDGSTIWLRVNGVPHFGPDGEWLGYRGTGLDITAQKEAEDALASARDRIHAILESIQDSFYSLDNDLRFTYVNSSAAEGFPGGPEYLINKHLWEIHKDHHWRDVKHHFTDAITLQRPQVFEHFEPASMSWYEFRLYPNNDAGVSVFYQDITERKAIQKASEQNIADLNEAKVNLEIQHFQLEQVNAKLRSLASTDGLTGLKNHKTFQEFLQEEFAAARRLNTQLGVVLMDVDNFKAYNDSFGHPAGDEVLKKVAKVLRASVASPHFVARYGGEEFVIVTVGLSEAETIDLAEECRIALEENDWPHRPITGSFGVAMMDETTETRQQVIERSDRALYASKAGGRNCVTLWKPWHEKAA